MKIVSGYYTNASNIEYVAGGYATDLLSQYKDSGKTMLDFGDTDIFYQKEPLGNFIYEFSLPKNSRVKKAVLKVKGIRYKGAVKYPGISITPVDSYNFIVDFHSFRTLYGVAYAGATANISEVKQWGGINFLKDNISLSSFGLIKTEKISVAMKMVTDPGSFERNFSILVISYPLNLTLALGDESPFWSYPGELTGEVTVPDFSEKLRDYIESCKSGKNPGTVCKIPLKFHSDSPGSIDIERNIDYNLIWDNPVLSENGEEKVLQPVFDGNEKKTVRLGLDSSKNSIQLISISFDCKGNFSNEFIDDSLSGTDKKLSIKISTGMSVGLKLKPSSSLNATGVDLYLSKKNKDAKLFAEITEDREGSPAEEKVLSSKNVDLSLQSPGQDGWVAVNFDDTVPLEGGKAYWLVLKAGIGEAEWLCGEDLSRPDSFKFRKESGISWTDYHSNQSSNKKVPITGYFRLKYLAGSADILPVTLKILGQSKDLKPETESQPIVISLEETTPVSVGPDGKAKIDLDIISKTSGALEITGIAVEGKEVM